MRLNKGYYKLKVICLLVSLLFPISWSNLSILTCPDHSADILQRACLYCNKKKSDYVLITITGRNVLNIKNFDLPEVRTATRSSSQALFQGTLSPLPRELRHFFKNVPCIKRWRHKKYVVILQKQLPVDVRTIEVRALSSLSLQACETVFPCNTVKPR